MEQFTQHQIINFRRKLIDWYIKHRRLLPWRGDVIADIPSFPVSPYSVLVSEAMLQQTRVETVIPYWAKWMKTFPTVAELAQASADEVNQLWAGLGYYRRAQNLRKAAIEIMSKHNGILPRTSESLLGLPGVGPYTCGAVRSIAFGEAAPLVDGNVIRVFSRLRRISFPQGSKELDKLCWQLAAELLDDEQPGQFNQALMELGALVCRPAVAECESCPVASFCLAKQQSDKAVDIESCGKCNEVIDYPIKAVKKKAKELTFDCFVFCKSEIENTKTSTSEVSEPKYLFVRRPDSGLLANQWEFPCIEIVQDRACSDDEDEDLSTATDSRMLEPSQLDSRSSLRDVIRSLKLQHGLTLQFPASDQIADASSPGIVSLPVIVHVFSHQRHTMNIRLVNGIRDENETSSKQAELSTSTSDCIGIPAVQSIGLREYRWMTAEEILAVGITSGCKKVLRSVVAFRGASRAAEAKPASQTNKRRRIVS